MPEKLQSTDYITIRPLDRAELVIQVMFVKELNEAWKGSPAVIFLKVPNDKAPGTMKEIALGISSEEYARLKYVLTGDLAMPAEALKEAYEVATAKAKKTGGAKKK